MQRVLSLGLILILTNLAVASPLPQEPGQTQTQTAATELTNKDVLDMVKAGLATEIVVAKIKASPGKFETSAATLAELKSANVPDAVIIAMLGSSGESAAAAEEPTPLAEVKVPDGTEIEIQLKNTASGQELKVGDIVDFSVVRPVIVNGVTIIDKDAPARARITAAKKAGHWGHAGKLEWAMQDVQGVDGSRLPARFTKRLVGDSKGNTVAVAAVATTVLLGPFGLLWGLKKGKPAIIPAGNRYSAFVSGDTAVKGKPTTNTP
ncbi:MAG TPA: hypothetical protein VMZ30_05640 [Pyrinomonadaceae bacterium]|nr:hypothetical protein [Pyrinomonadaceae bacterium]